METLVDTTVRGIRLSTREQKNLRLNLVMGPIVWAYKMQAVPRSHALAKDLKTAVQLVSRLWKKLGT